MTKKLISTVSAILCIVIANGQRHLPDSLKNQLTHQIHDTTRVLLLTSVSQYFEHTRPDTAMLLARQGYTLSEKIDFIKGRGKCLNIMGRILMRRDNFSTALQTELQALQHFEILGDVSGEALVYYDIGNIYERLADHHQALNNFMSSVSFARAMKDSVMLINGLGSIGFNYYKINRLDSALKYAQQAYGISMITDFRLPWSLALLGGIQDKMGNTNIAIAYYQDALTRANERNEFALFPYVYQAVATLYMGINAIDSAIAYGEKAFSAAQLVNFTTGKVESSALLAQLYAGRDNAKAVSYFQVCAALEDSIFSQEKVRQIQNISYNEEERQQELQRQKQQALEERKVNLQYAAITIGLISFIILFLLLTHTVLANERIIKFLGIVGLLVAFEFVNLLLHPFLGAITHHSPFMMLIAMVIVAALLVPAHHYLERTITHKMVEKNKQVRLAAAQKTIEQLGGDSK
jgi:tetratricopeptide (TPR) repeat protein